MIRCRRWLPLLLLSLLLAGHLSLADEARAQDETKAYHWDSIDVSIVVQPSGDLEVVETQRYVFTQGTFHYADRWMPLARVTAIDNVWVEGSCMAAWPSFCGGTCGAASCR